MSRIRTKGLVAVAAFVTLAAAGDASAATIAVGTTADTSASACTLRDAITAANTNSAAGACTAGSGTDTIDLSTQNGTITLGSALPVISSSVDLVGPGPAALTVDGAGSFRVLNFSTGTSSLTGLRLNNGHCGFGCAINNDATLQATNVRLSNNVAEVDGGVNAFPQGGAIRNTGSLTLTLSTMDGNSVVANGASNQNAAVGGAAYNNGGATLTLDRTSAVDNHATAVAAGAGTTSASGGAISNAGTLNVLRSTIAGNSASGTGSATSNRGNSGAIGNANSGSVNVVIDRSTIAGNSVTATGPGGSSNDASIGGFEVTGATFSIKSSTIARNSAPSTANISSTGLATISNSIVSNPQGGGANCASPMTSQGHNISDGTGCGFTQAGDQQSTNPLLDPAGLANHGGPTQTIALMPNSPAVDHGLAAAGETVDQRGEPRPVDQPGAANGAGSDGSDVGAYEVGDVDPPDTTISSGPADGSTITTDSTSFAFDSTEAGSSFECSLDGAAFAPCTSPKPIGPLANGSHTFAVRAIDAAANTDPSPASRTFQVAVAVPDTRAPEVTITKAPKRKLKKKSATVAFSSDEAGSHFECRLDAGAYAPCTSPAALRHLKKGKHVFSVRAIDTAGNVGNAATATFKVVKRKRKK